MSNLNNQFTNAISNLNQINVNAPTVVTSVNTANLATCTNLPPSNITTTNVILQTLKRRNTKVVVPLDERVTLEKAYGFTITSNSRLTQSCDGTIAYLAGCVIVLHDRNKQNQEFIISHARKTLTTVAFSADGRCLATGESGHEPKVRVWDVKEKIQICEFGGHKFSIECVCFSTNLQSNLIVSIGSIHDMVVNVWNLKTKFKVASNKIACKVKGIAFTRDGSFFVTVGNRHVKYWYLTVSSLMETVPLKGRAAILGEMRNSYFCDVVCGTGECVHSTYTITTNGVLCEFNNEQRCITRNIELRTEHAYCIYADNRENLFIGCSNGSILMYRQKNLDLLASLPRPHSLGVDISKGLDMRHIIENLGNHELKYPDCVALCYDNHEGIISAIYNDHSFYVWDIKDPNKVKKLDSHLFHSSCCWSLDTFAGSLNNSQCSQQLNLPLDSFITCSSDNTVRIWSTNTTVTPGAMLKRNIYSKELLKIIYIENDLSALCEIDPTSENADQLPNQQSIQQQQQQQQTVANSVTNLPVGSINNMNVNSNELANNSKMGARCLKISPFGKHLATGDRNGNIRITDLSTLESIALIEAHDGEVLYLQYSQPESNRLLLASSSRDRLIHIFDASRNTYDLLQTLDDHSAAITAVRFCFNQIEKQLYIISCGADKSIMFRTATSNSDHSGGISSLTSSGVGSSSSSTVSSSSSSPNFNSSTTTSNQSAQFQFVRTSYVAEKQTFYDLNLDPARNYIYTISQDRIIRTYSIKDGKKLRQFRGSLNEDGYLLKMDIDRTGSLLATSCTDKCVYIWDINTTECVAYLCGHSEVVTDLKFTADQQHLITVSADGCVFMWKLNNLLNTQMANSEHTSNGLPWPSSTRKLSSNYSSSSSSSNIVQIDTNINKLNMNTTTPTQLSLDSMFDSDNEQLPAWARNKLNSGGVSSSIDNSIASACLNDSENVKMLMSEMGNDQPRRGRAVWGPVLDASLSFMVDNENQSIISSPNSFFVEENGNESSSNHSWIIEKEESNEELDTEDTSYDSVHTTIVHNNSQFDETSAMVPTIPEENIDEQTQSQTANSDPKTLSNNIQFPSPCVDKDVFLVKKLNQLKEAISSSSSPNTNTPNMSSVRKSWICSSNEEDLLFSLLNKMKPENSSSFDSDQELMPGATSSLIDSHPEALPVCTASSLSEATSSSDELISSGGNKSSSFLSTDSPLSRTQSLLGDTTIKLDCDLENSFRRQSISARYLLRAQQQQQQQHHHQNQPVNKSFEHEKSQSPTYSMSSSSTSSSVHSSPNLKKDLYSKPPPSPTSTFTTTTSTPSNTTSSTVNSEQYLCIKETEEEIDLELIAASTTPIPTPIPVSNSSSSNNNNNNNTTNSKANSSVNSNQINIGQMAADLLKMRKKAVQLTTQPNSINNTSNNKLLHSHHTESSLNKTKQKQAQHQRQHQDQLGQNPLLKRSPSVNSIVAGTTQTNATISSSDVAILQALPAHKNGLLSVGGDSSASSSSSSIKLSSKPKLSPKQHSNSQHTNSTASSSSSAANNASEDNNLKKAVSMITLFSNQASTKPSSAITTATTASAKSYSNGSQKNIASSSSSACSSNKPEPINSGTLLPPKTVRQVKQRSAERQLTSTAILTSTVTPKLSSSTGITSNIAANTFNEQKKHLRKLSNSIQNLHQVVASATAPPSTSSVDLTSGGTGVAAAVNAFNKMNGNNLLPPQPPPTKSSPKSLHFGSAATQQTRNDSKNLTSSNSISLDQTADTFLLQSDGKQDQENEKQQISSVNSLISSSSSSSSCSLFDNVSSISSSTGQFDAVKSLEGNADDVSSSSSNSTNTNNKSKSSGFNSRFSENTNRQQNANSSSFNITNSPSSSTACSLKKPITFASIAAAANSGISSPLPITSSSHISSPQPSKFTSYSNTVSPLTSNKIESIIDEFKKNVFLLQLVSNQTPKIAEDLSKFHPNSVGLQSSASHQTIQLMQTFNTTVQSLVYKFNSSLNAIKLSSVVQQQQQQSTPLSTTLSSNELTSSNSETIKLDTDLEIS